MSDGIRKSAERPRDGIRAYGNPFHIASWCSRHTSTTLGNLLAAIQNTGNTLAENLRVPVEFMGVHHQEAARFHIEGDTVPRHHQQSAGRLTQRGECAEPDL